MIPTDLGTLLVSACLGAALGVGFYRDRQVVALLADRFAKMLPTTVAYEALFGVAVVVELTSESGTADPAALVAGALAVGFSWCGSWFMNDVFDKESDQASDERRATADGRLTDRQTLVAAVVLWGASLGYAALLGVVAVTAALGMIALNLVYSVPPLRLKESGLGSMGAIGLMGATAVFLGSGTVVSAPSSTIWQFAGVVTVFMMLNLSYKDLKDAEEDAETGVENFVVSFGKRRVQWFLVVSLPSSYLLGALAVGVTTPPTLAVIGLVGLGAAGLLVTHDISTPTLTYRLDVVNAIYLFALAGSYYVVYA